MSARRFHSSMTRISDLVTGITANTLARVDLVEKLTGLRALDLRRKRNQDAVDRMLAQSLEL